MTASEMTQLCLDIRDEMAAAFGVPIDQVCALHPRTRPVSLPYLSWRHRKCIGAKT